MRWAIVSRIVVLILVAAFVSFLVLGLFRPKHPLLQELPNIGAGSGLATPSPTPSSTLFRIDRPASGPIRAIFSGEDLTHGLYASAATDTYVSRVDLAIEKQYPISSTITGTAGQSITDALKQPMPSGVNLFVVEFGTIEAAKSDPATFGQEYSLYLDRVVQTNPKATLVCLGSWTYVPKSTPIDNAIESSCTAHNGTFVTISDLYTASGNPYRATPGKIGTGSEVVDNYHANDAGHAAISDRITDQLAAN
jgi:hypothetical protein